LRSKSQRGRVAASALNQHIRHLTFTIDRPPPKHVTVADSDHHFVEMPSIVRARTATPETRGDL
jgi:hypothetical protein